MKGIILAGGSGTRLYPLTKSISKQLMPIYDKPMIYYPLTALMLMDIKEILVITTSQDQSGFQKLLGDGSRFGISIEYTVQERPNGLAEAFILGEKFIDNQPVTLILGDNFFYGQHFSGQIKECAKYIKLNGGGYIFGALVKKPQAYGVVEFDENKKVISIEEKPKKPKSNYAIPGIYVFDQSVCEKAKKVKPSERGELEITSVMEAYLKEGMLKVELFGRGMSWLDTGTHSDLLEAASFVKTIQERQGLLIGSPEEVAYTKEWIDREKFKNSIKELQKSEYGQVLKKILN